MIQLAYIVVALELWTGWHLTEWFTLLYCLTGITLEIFGRRLGAYLFALMWYAVLHGNQNSNEVF